MAQDISHAAGSEGGACNDTNMQIFMEEVKADKKLLVASNMDLNDAEGKKFWPLYEAYQKDLEQINQRIGSTINTYAKAYGRHGHIDDPGVPDPSDLGPGRQGSASTHQYRQWRHERRKNQRCRGGSCRPSPAVLKYSQARRR